MGIGRTAGDNREEIGVHRLREYRAIMFGTKIFNPDAGDNFARYDGKVDVGFGGETIRVPLTSSDPGTWALIAAVSMEGSEPEVINLNHIASMEPTESDVWRLVLGQEPPARPAPALEAASVESSIGQATERVVGASSTPSHDAAQAPVSPHRGILVLVLGIAGICFFPVAIAAIVVGLHDLAEMKKGRRDAGGRGMTLGGVVTAAVGLVFLVLYFVSVIFAMIFISPR